ncbi:hypothetical protein FOPG_14655 [Fusarium oxysporum f. sp. conglutinans race 2 54008]|uniref:Uncharacterized protein n=1 Tax=Fusarium oxysporum f. sp. conglutinans race 2 54008 TaxID=1089457 RepID=X0I806_FUSOX|nr:hypothetical protein FOPG_14655 [Fusarium oxysporum f. sp. conglutinans race 2 54008]
MTPIFTGVSGILILQWGYTSQFNPSRDRGATPNINEYSWAVNHEQSPAGAAFYISQLECLDSQGLHANWGSGSLLQGLIANLPIKKNDEYSSTGKWHEYTYYYKEMRGQRVVTTPSADEFFKVYATPGWEPFVVFTGSQLQRGIIVGDVWISVWHERL